MKLKSSLSIELSAQKNFYNSFRENRGWILGFHDYATQEAMNWLYSEFMYVATVHLVSN